MIDHVIRYFCFMVPASARSSSPVVSLTCTATRWFSIFCVCLISISVNGQDSLIQQKNIADSARIMVSSSRSAFPKADLDFAFSKKKVRQVTAANIIAYGALTTGLYAAWYSNYPQSGFHTISDLEEWQQIDKIGHVYSAYTAGKVCMEMWRWTGIDRKKRIWIGGLSGVAYQTIIETLDGFSANWGWSWGDFGANVLGSGLLIGQELAWDEQKVQMKFSAHRKIYSDDWLNKRSDDQFGKSLPERILKDYNGQTYWLSTGLKTIFPQSKLPAWLQVSVGTGADGMFGARDNIKLDDQDQVIYDLRQIKRYRQWYLAPDIDLSKIKTRKKGVRLLLNMLNVIKCPAPALEYSQGKLRWHWVLF